MADKDVIILKSIEPPTMNDFSELIANAHKEATMAGLTKQDVKDAIKEARKKKWR